MFRETHLERLLTDFTKNPFSGSDDQWVAAIAVVGVTVTFALPMIASHYVERLALPRLRNLGVWWLPVETFAWSVLVMVMFIYWRASAYDFVYFQF
jgi:hypothetical protein